MKKNSLLTNNQSIIKVKIYLVFLMIPLFINFSCKNSNNKQEVSSITESLVSSQEAFLKNMVPHFKQSDMLYRKYKTVYARKAIIGEKIMTITDDGLETSNTAKEGDFVVKNQTDAQEMYILSSEKFNKRYHLLKNEEGEFSEYQPTGKIFAIELTSTLLSDLGLENEFNFIAPWGEKMVAKKGDYIVCPPDFSEVYRIAKKEFFETYILDDN